MAEAVETRVRIQNLRNFTVRVQHCSSGEIVGTGLAVSADGKIVTCAHVVEAAGVDPRVVDGGEIGVYFPQVRDDEQKARRAKVAACFPMHDDDVVLLQLTDGPPPLGPEQIAKLGFADGSEGNAFRSYGYRPLNPYNSGWADGKIMGLVECPEGGCYQTEPVQLRSSEIDRGMSGAAVLDTEKNLVVGIISETWFPDVTLKDRDTAWAVNTRVLGFDPLLLPLQDQPEPKTAGPQPRTDTGIMDATPSARPGVVWNNAPASLPEWAGRADMLREIASDWDNPDCRVTELIGFGGEGKSSLARKAVDELLARSNGTQPDGVFWWGFYGRPSLDEFFESALKYISGGLIDPRNYPSSSAKAHLIAGMLARGRYLFVLDGLEVLQNQEGDRYGLLPNTDMREFLGYLASNYHNSFCLITSRVPVLDLMEYTTHTHRDVDRLSKADGRELLRNLGVKGKDNELEQVVEDWAGHALMLSLLGGCLAEQHGGDIAHIGEAPPPEESLDDRVRRILRRYDEHLTDPEQAFLTIFSAFRLPVGEDAFEKVFRAEMGANALNAPLVALSKAGFTALVARLAAYRILRADESDHTCAVHPLIHAHYSERLGKANQSEAQALHKRIKDYYLEIGGEPPRFPTMDDLKPFIEAVHHACQAGDYDGAYGIVLHQIYQGARWVLTHILGAYETQLALVMEFFPNQDTEKDPQLEDASQRRFVLNDVGFCLMSLGRLSEVAPFYQRANKINLDITKDWKNAGVGFRNLAELYSHLGMLREAATAAEEALAMAKKAKDARAERNSLAYQGWVLHLMGDLDTASADYLQAQALEHQVDKDKEYLYGLRGIWHADHLRRMGDHEYARKVTVADHAICERNRLPADLSRCRRVLGDLDANAGKQDSAREHYDEALKLARGISKRDVLIEALLARGRWYAKHMSDPRAAFSDLNEAFEYATSSGYRIHEADIRIALAWAHIAAANPDKAATEALRAKQMSADMGYYWGKLDADEILTTLNTPRQ